MNGYLGKWGLTVRSGHIESLTINIEGDLSIDGLQVIVGSLNEENLVFYDAVEDSLVDLPSPDTIFNNIMQDLASDLDTNVSHIEEVPGSTHKAPATSELIRYTLQSILSKYALTIQNSKIEFLGAQNYQSIQLVVPMFTCYQGFLGTNDIILEVGNGLKMILQLKDEGIPLISTDNPVSVTIGRDEYDTRRKTLVSLSNVETLLELHKVKLFMDFFDLYSSPHLHRGKDQFKNINFSIKVKTLSTRIVQKESVERILNISNFFIEKIQSEITLAFDDVKVEGVISIPTAKFCLNSSIERLIGEFDLIQVDKIGKEELDIFKELNSIYNSSYSRGSERNALVDFSMKMKIAKITINEFKYEELIISGLVEDLDILLDRLQSAIHISQGSIKIQEESSMVKFRKMSLFHSYRTSLSQKSILQWPFKGVVNIIEGEEYVNVQIIPEDYFLLRAKVIEDSIRHYHFSMESISIETELSKINQIFHSHRSNDNLINNSGCECITGVIQQFDMVEKSLNLSLKGAAVEVLGQFINGKEKFIDIRLDMESFTNGHQEDLMRKALTMSLDPHYKPTIFTIMVKPLEMIVSAKLQGAVIQIPLFHTANDEILSLILSMFDGNQKEISPITMTKKIFFEFALCSFKTTIDTPYKDKIPPHILYCEQLRTIFKGGNEEMRCFLERGEVMIAPGVDLIKPVTGLFDEGHNYWVEQNYETICTFDFIPASMSADLRVLIIEDNMMTVDMHKDSFTVMKKILSVYNQILQDRRTPNSSSDILKPVIFNADKDEKEEDNGELLPLFSIDLKADDDRLEVDENYYKMEGIFEENFDDIWGSGEGGDGDCDGEEETLEIIIEEEEVNDILDDSDDILFYNQGKEIDSDDVLVEELDIEEDFISTLKIENSSSMYKNYNEEPIPIIEEAMGVFRIVLRDVSVKVRLFEGKLFHPDRTHHVTMEHFRQYPPPFILDDGSELSISPKTMSTSSMSRWSSIKTRSRAGSGITGPDYVEFSLSGVGLSLDFGNPGFLKEEDYKTIKSVKFSVQEVDILDYVKTSQWRTLLTRRRSSNKSKNGKACINSSEWPMIKMDLDTFFVPNKEAKYVEEQLEFQVKIELEPLRVFLDQDTLIYLLKWVEPLRENPTMNSNPTGMFIQKLQISPLSIRFDYKPKKMNVKGLLKGRHFELLNVFALEDAEINLPRVDLTGISSLGNLKEGLMRVWLPFVKATQMPSVATGIVPVRSVMTVGGGISDLVLLPIQQYRRNGRLLQGLKRGTRSFLYSTALEGTRLGRSLASGAHNILSHASDVVCVSGSLVEDEATGNSQRAGDVCEGLTGAYKLMAKELQVAKKTVIAVPVMVYEQQGPGGAMKAVLRALPIAVLHTMLGATEAVNTAMSGIQSSLDPDSKSTSATKYKT